MNPLQWLWYYRCNPWARSVAIRNNYKKKDKSGLLGVGVIGCGGGGLMHISHYLWHRETDVRGVFDIDESRFTDLNRRFPFMRKDVTKTTRLGDILDNDDIQAVSVCSPDHTHAEYAIAALKAGKHVLCEKPMCTTIEDCFRIIEEAEKARRIFVVFQQMRFVPRNAAIAKLAREGVLGDIFYIETAYIHDMRRRATEFSQWRMDKKNFQHPLFGGCHHFDLLRSIAGEITEVYTIGTNKGLDNYPADDTYVTTIRLSNSGIGRVLTCFGPRVPKEFHPIRVYGTKGSVHDTTLFLDSPNGVLTKSLRTAEYGGIPEFRKQISHFVDCVRGRAKPMVPPLEGARTVAASWAAVESWKTGRPIKVPEFY